MTRRGGGAGRGLLVGMDVGGTKVAIRAETWAGETVADQVQPAGGWRVEPAEDAVGWLLAQMRAVLPKGSKVDAAAIGAQQCNTDRRGLELEAALRRRGIPAAVVNDAMLLVHAAGLDHGMGVIAGTGSIAVGRSAGGRFLIAGGWGWVLGDEGGAATLVREAARAALLAWDEGRPDRELMSRLQRALSVPDPDRLILSITEDPSPAHLGPLAPVVFAAADAGSPIARQVVEGAATSLATLVDRLRRKGAAGRAVIASGGVITRQPRLFNAFRAGVLRTHPDLSVQLLEKDPVSGALVLARRLAEAEAASRSALPPE